MRKSGCESSVKELREYSLLLLVEDNPGEVDVGVDVVDIDLHVCARVRRAIAEGCQEKVPVISACDSDVCYLRLSEFIPFHVDFHLDLDLDICSFRF